MGEELVPCGEWEGRVERGECGDEMVLERADGSFGPVGAVHASCTWVPARWQKALT